MKSDRRDLSKRSKAALCDDSPFMSAITGELSSSDSEYDDLVEPQAPKAAQLRMMAMADSLTRIIAFVREGMTQIKILTSNCTSRPVRPQGERFCSREGQTERWSGADLGFPLSRHLPVSPIPPPPVHGEAMISAACS